MNNGSSKKVTPAVILTAEERVRMFNAVWVATDKDYRGTTEDGAKAILGYAEYGSGVQTAKTISEEELRERYAETQKKSIDEPHWLDEYIKAEAAHYGLTVSQKDWLFDGLDRFTEADEIASKFV